MKIIHVKKKLKLAACATTFGLIAFLIPTITHAQLPGIKRTELQRRDLSVKGREVIQVRIDFDPGSAFGKHTHPGEEIIYVIEGLLEYQVEGKPAVTLKAGEVLFIPPGVVHSAKNVGKTSGAELATYVVEKGKKVVVLVD
jgi:quercetin dioxygenase-like cupin family protein